VAEDLLTQRIEQRDGRLSVPKGPGLGVDVDLEKVRDFARRNELEGDHTL
jgi:L-alanine-DL-glutamate epimerase-like enolase superfamily enzyme